jgi:hypothetical protein
LRALAYPTDSETSNPLIYSWFYAPGETEELPIGLEPQVTLRGLITSPAGLPPVVTMARVYVGSLSSQGSELVALASGELELKAGILLVTGPDIPGRRTWRAAPAIAATAATIVLGAGVFAGTLQDQFDRIVNVSSAQVFVVGSSVEETTIETEILASIGRFSFEDLEDGMTANLGDALAGVMKRFGGAATLTLRTLIESSLLSPELASHSLRWLGRMKDPATHQARFALLAEMLSAGNPYVRDGAALGLLSLRDKAAIPALKRAVGRESRKGLRADLQRTLGKLEGM